MDLGGRHQEGLANRNRLGVERAYNIVLVIQARIVRHLLTDVP